MTATAEYVRPPDLNALVDTVPRLAVLARPRSRRPTSRMPIATYTVSLAVQSILVARASLACETKRLVVCPRAVARHT